VQPSHVSPHQAWLPAEVLSPLAGATAAVLGQDICLDTVRGELSAAGAVPSTGEAATYVVTLASVVEENPSAVGLDPGEDVFQNDGAQHGFVVLRRGGRTIVIGADGQAALQAFYALLRDKATGRMTGVQTSGDTTSAPHQLLRMLDHWDNVAVHPVMGQVERGYSGGSIFYDDGRVRQDLSRVSRYARLLAAIGINAVAINNVNVHDTEAHLLTDGLADVARISAEFRPYAITTYLAVAFDSPIRLGGLETCDPLNPDVAAWWRQAADRVYTKIADFGGFLVKADSEGQPGPFAYGRTHAEGANVLAAALEPHGGRVLWRAFVYNHQQDWRDRSTDRARAAYDHFTPLDGQFASNVVLQVKHGPIDFQTREPVSPVLAALPNTPIAVEFQITQEYTGQQRHVCYLAPSWSENLEFRLDGARTVAQISSATTSGRTGGIVGVSNVGTDKFWTWHPLAQANLYAFGRLAWDPSLSPAEVLDEWIAQTFAEASNEDLARIATALHAMMDDSWLRYEGYTAPLGVGFMVNPHHHYGPAVDGYEYAPWGTYHFADRDGIGVDRTCATGTGFTSQYPSPWRELYESVDICPDDLLLFFHHVPYGHVLHSGKTVIRHIYDSRADAVEALAGPTEAWEGLSDLVGGPIPVDLDRRIRELLAEQLSCAIDWRDQVRSYFFRKSGVPDDTGRRIY